MNEQDFPGADDYTLGELAKLEPWQQRLARILMENLGWSPGTDFTFKEHAGEWRIICPHYPANSPDAQNATDSLLAYTVPGEDPMALDPEPEGDGFAITLAEV